MLQVTLMVRQTWWQEVRFTSVDGRPIRLLEHLCKAFQFLSTE